MRKLIASVLCLMLILGLCACQNQSTDPAQSQAAQSVPEQDAGIQVFRFPEGTTLCGQDLSGMLGNSAYSKMREITEKYTLSLTINDKNILLTGEEMGLQFHADVMAQFIDAVKSGEDTSAYVPISYNPKQLETRISVRINELPKNPSMVYDADANSFVFTDYVTGTDYDLSAVMEELDPVVLALDPVYTTTAASTDTLPLITADSERGLAIQEKVNSVLRTALTYSYAPDGSKAVYEALTIDDIGSFVTIDEDYNPVVNVDAVNAYAEKMGERFSVGENDGKFLTSRGEWIDMKITYADQSVDTQALAEDIVYCLENGISGVRSATYSRKGSGWTFDFGGNYVEIDLTAQRMWVYNDYECKLYTHVVTGNLSEDWDTPTGIFKVYQHIYPTKAGRVFRYWLPFYRAYGLHDANWRSEYRDDEYLFEGSHGCVNTPPEYFPIVYDNVSVGTPVIIYGGANKEEGAQVTQEIYGTTEYNVGVDVKKFTLDATLKYGTTDDLYYTSSNPEVAKVSDDGIVTVLTTGTAKITVTSRNWDFCPSTEKVVTIKVHEDCSKVGHMIVNWKQIKAPTCTATGIEKGVCTSCDYTQTRTLEVTHDFYFPAYMHPQSWVVTKASTCTEPGEKYRTCSDCGYQEVAEVPAEGHVPVCWQTTAEPTETTPGEMVAYCYYCYQEFTKEIPPLS